MSDSIPTRRGRGRPRKTPIHEDNPLPFDEETTPQYVDEPIIPEEPGIFEEDGSIGKQSIMQRVMPLPEEQKISRMDDLLETSLQQEVETENNIKSVSKELFNRQNLDLKSEVSHDEVNHLTRMRFLQAKFGISNVDVLSTSFLGLRVSMNRKSRTEFIEALQTERRQQSGNAGLFGRLFSNQGNNNQP